MESRVLSYPDGCLTIYENPTSSLLSVDALPDDGVICMFCKKGSIQYDSGMHKAVADKPGSLAIATSIRAGEISVKDGFEGMVLVLSAQFADSLNLWSSCLLKQSVVLQIEDLGEHDLEFVNLIHKSVCNCLESGFQGSKEILSLLFKSFFLRIESKLNMAKSGEDSLRTAKISRKFLKLAAEHSARHRDLTFYAKELCITPKYLSAVVSKATGRKALQWIEDYAILSARRMLKDTDLTINQIADSMNFITPSDFCRYFRSRMGMTPRQYRQD